MIGLLIVLAMLWPGAGGSGTAPAPASGGGQGAAAGGAGSTVAPTPVQNVPASIMNCMNGNWQSYTINGLQFKNETDCDVYVIIKSII